MINEIEYKKLEVPEHYEITEDGRVFNIPTGKEIFPNKKNLFVLFDKNDVYKYVPKVLIATKFVPNPDGCRYVHNIDGDKNNISARNLKWVNTNRPSSKDAFKIKRVIEYLDNITEFANYGETLIIQNIKNLLK